MRWRPLAAIPALLPIALPAQPHSPHQVQVEVQVGDRPVATFAPDEVFGAGIDGGGKGEIAPIFTPHNRAAVLSAGFRRVAYRLRTELAIEAWHWSTTGNWSDPVHQQGYWTGDPLAESSGQLTYGYRLPRRGDTLDEANNDGYSRLDDGDAKSFWKSNPYLDESYTGEPGEHPEWVVIELDRRSAVDTLRVTWGHPFARLFTVQYWDGADPYDGHWRDFAGGRVTGGTGNTEEVALARVPVRTRYVRLLLQQSSHTAQAGASDQRDHKGFAIAELSVGRKRADGSFLDLIRHGTARREQTVMHVSSTDPWHRAVDRDDETEQPSLRAILDAGLMGHGPMMVPAGILYDTPENALAELHYVQRAGLPVRQVELGEEPDGQLVSAADYGALFLEFARRIHQATPEISVGGPSLVNGISDTWLDGDEDQSWTSQFFKYLRAHHGLDQLGFFSFELFPFDNMCGSARAKLLRANGSMRELYKRLGEDGVPTTIPWVISEYGFSAFAGQAMVEMPSALLNADMVADFLTRGGSASYLYGYGPNRLLDGEARCAGRGNMMLWQADEKGEARWPMPTYFGARMLTQFWAQPGAAQHLLYRATANVRDPHGRASVTAYPVLRPDGRWALMLINRAATPVSAKVHFRLVAAGAPGPAVAAGRPVVVAQYGPAQYAWRSGHPDGHPIRDRAPKSFTIPNWDSPIILPAVSLTVLRGDASTNMVMAARERAVVHSPLGSTSSSSSRAAP